MPRWREEPRRKLVSGRHEGRCASARVCLSLTLTAIPDDTTLPCGIEKAIQRRRSWRDALRGYVDGALDRSTLQCVSDAIFQLRREFGPERTSDLPRSPRVAGQRVQNPSPAQCPTSTASAHPLQRWTLAPSVRAGPRHPTVAEECSPSYPFLQPLQTFGGTSGRIASTSERSAGNWRWSP